MTSRFLTTAAALLVMLAACDDINDPPITEEIFVNDPAQATPTAPTVVVPTEPTYGPDGQIVDPALALVEEDPYTTIEEGGADGLTERLPDTCKLENYQMYRGQTVAAIEAAGLTVPYRIVGIRDIVTQEYNPMRVNFYVGNKGTIEQVACG